MPARGIAVGIDHLVAPTAAECRAVEARESATSDPVAREAFDEDLDRGQVLSRRRLLRRSLGAAVVALGVAFLFPLRSLGPRPTRQCARTRRRGGTGRVWSATTAGPCARGAVPANGLVTVFPDGAANSETGQAVLVRVDPDVIRPLPGREDWSPEGFVAYSKVCTHAGCPVGLYEATSHQLLCPCHQSTFDVLDGATPVFGPAAAPLPQLPLAIDADGLPVRDRWLQRAARPVVLEPRAVSGDGARRGRAA